MATTTNFGWETPDDTDLVKDGAAAMRTLGNSIDTSFVDLKGGTSGQILSKASNTDLDYTWIDNQVGDITSITATSPLTGGGTGGDVTVGIQDATTSVKGAVQLTDSTSSTSTTTAATPNSVKSAYDLAGAAIPKTIADAKGDLVAATAADTFSRLAVGTNGYVLTADSAETTGLKWAAPAGGGKVLQVVNSFATTTVTVTTGTFTTLASVTITPSASTSKVLILFNGTFEMSGTDCYTKYQLLNNGGTELVRQEQGVNSTALFASANVAFLDSPASTSALTYTLKFAKDSGSTTSTKSYGGYSIMALEIGA